MTKDPTAKIRSIYTAHSKHYFFAREFISAFVLKQNALPLNPFMNWNYFLSDLVDRQLVVRANNNLILLADELWQFGPIADGCYHEIELAIKLGKKIRFFSVGKTLRDIHELDLNHLAFEPELSEKVNIGEFLIKLKSYSQ